MRRAFNGWFTRECAVNVCSCGQFISCCHEHGRSSEAVTHVVFRGCSRCYENWLNERIAKADEKFGLIPILSSSNKPLMIPIIFRREITLPTFPEEHLQLRGVTPNRTPALIY